MLEKGETTQENKLLEIFIMLFKHDTKLCHGIGSFLKI
jgi:hypothetical protein